MAHIFEEAGFKQGDAVALLLDNRPEYVALWLGLAKIGVVTALINYNLKDKPLLHSIQIAESKAVIVGKDFLSGNLTKIISTNPFSNNKNVLNAAFNDIRTQLDSKIKFFAFDFGKNSQVPNGMENLDTLLDEASSSPITGQRVNYGDKLLYIYTSGTTGLPKAVRVLKIDRTH
jgi:solute carrier family 27 fatty acid transporter 1/4